MFLGDSVASLPNTGPTWDALVAKANTDPGDPNLGALDQLGPAANLSLALRWAKDGGGLGKARVVQFVSAAQGTENTAGQPLNVYRTVAAIVIAADTVGMTGAEIGKNGQSFNDWVRSLFYKSLPPGNNPNWDTMYKCIGNTGNNWGACAMTSALACSLWMIKKGLAPSGVAAGGPSTATGIRDFVIAHFKRWCGDTSVPNTWVTTGNFQQAWSTTGTYPTGQGVINPTVSGTKAWQSGANCEDASRSTYPTKTGAGQHYQYESLDSAAVTIALLVNAGYADAATYGNSGIKRNYQYMINNGLDVPSTDYHHFFWMQPFFANYMWGVGMPIPSNFYTDRAQRRNLTTHTDWLTAGASTWLKTAGGGGTGGGTTTPTVVAPTATLTLASTAVAGTSVTASGASSTAGSAAITGYRFDFGDGTVVPSSTTFQSGASATHSFAATATITRNVTLTVTAADGGTDTDTKSILVTVADGKPVAQISLAVNSGSAPLDVPWDMSASFDPDGDAITNYRVDWGDGIVTNSATATGTRTFSTVGSWTGNAYVTAAGVESAADQFTVTVLPAITVDTAVQHFVALNGQKVPVLPPYSSAWDGPHMTMGGYHFWVSADGVLRVKSSAPVSDMDGTPIGASTGSGSLTLLPAGSTVPASTPSGTILFYN